MTKTPFKPSKAFAHKIFPPKIRKNLQSTKVMNTFGEVQKASIHINSLIKQNKPTSKPSYDSQMIVHHGRTQIRQKNTTNQKMSALKAIKMERKKVGPYRK